MPRKRGTPKTGGRTPGTPNKTTRELREALQSFIEDNIDSLQNDYNSIADADKKLSFFEKVVRLVLPPPVNPEKLTEEQILQVIDYLKRKEENEKRS